MIGSRENSLFQEFFFSSIRNTIIDAKNTNSKFELNIFVNIDHSIFWNKVNIHRISNAIVTIVTYNCAYRSLIESRAT